MPPQFPGRRWLFAGAFSATALAMGQPERARPGKVFAVGGVAIRGFDPVAYHLRGEPVRGSRQFSLPWRGATWCFASAEARDRFAAAPLRWAPAYGGFCAYAVSRGYPASTDPAAWRVIADRLYLNYNLPTQERWLRDVPGNIALADRNWPEMSEG